MAFLKNSAPSAPSARTSPQHGPYFRAKDAENAEEMLVYKFHLPSRTFAAAPRGALISEYGWVSGTCKTKVGRFLDMDTGIALPPLSKRRALRETRSE